MLTGRRIGVYQIQTLLGAGGMGEVYRARDTKLGRDVAFKILPRAFTADPDRLARFEREARVLASLNHPHIGAIYGVEESDGVHALVLELVEGETLADRLAKGALPLDQALRIAIQIASALDTAHRAGIVHRDLKPGNIMLTRSGGASAPPMAKLLDFGLAKASAPAVAGADRSMRPTRAAQLDGAGHDPRDVSVHGAGAARRPRGRRAHGHLRVRRGAVRDAHREEGVRGHEPRERECRDHVGGPDARLRAATAHAAGARPRRRHVPGQGS